MSIVAEIEFDRIPSTGSLISPDESVYLCTTSLREWFDVPPDVDGGWIVVSDEWMPDSVLMRVEVHIILWDPDQEYWIIPNFTALTQLTIRRALTPFTDYYVGLQVRDV